VYLLKQITSPTAILLTLAEPVAFTLGIADPAAIASKLTALSFNNLVSFLVAHVLGALAG
jgi:hypothetical protein